MSHLKERDEKVCLNCNASLHGFYCHVCGQENIEPKQSAWHLITHFLNDITHFDGKFFTTLKDLLVKPGFLSSEFISGRRIRYLHPIRMYIFTSAIFFIVFFSLYDVEHLPKNTNVKINNKGLAEAERDALAEAKTKKDSAAVVQAFSKFKNLPTTFSIDSASSSDNEDFFLKDANGHLFKSAAEYDSLQLALPEDKRDGWFKRMISHKRIGLNEKYKGNKQAFFEAWLAAFTHDFPKLLFVSLPIFALLLKLMYIRRKQFYYADHGIFAIHLYIYSFIALLLVFGFRYIRDLTGWSWLWIFDLAILFYTLYYFYKAMRNFYQQRRLKTFLKYVILYFLSLITIIILFIVFFAFSILQI